MAKRTYYFWLLYAATEDAKQNELKVAQETHKKKVDELQKTSQANLKKAQTLEAVSVYILTVLLHDDLINVAYITECALSGHHDVAHFERCRPTITDNYIIFTCLKSETT